MKDGRTHLAHKTEQAVDLTTGAIVSVTVQGANQGDTSTLGKTLKDAETQIERVQKRTRACHPGGLQEVVGDGLPLHCGSPGVGRCAACVHIRTRPWSSAMAGRHREPWPGVREPSAKRRGTRSASAPPPRRTGGATLRSSLPNRPHETPHLPVTRTSSNGCCSHSGAFNLGLLMRQIVGVGTPRGLQGRLHDLLAQLLHLWNRLTAITTAPTNHEQLSHNARHSAVALHRRLGRALTTDARRARPDLWEPWVGNHPGPPGVSEVWLR